MTRLIFSGVLLIVATGAGCSGGMADPRSAHRTADASHVLVSISVAPATADANNFPNGEVQFTAIGKFSDGTTAPIAVMWSAQPPFTTVADFFLLNSSGVGQCIAGGTEGKMTVLRQLLPIQSPAVADDGPNDECDRYCATYLSMSYVSVFLKCRNQGVTDRSVLSHMQI